METVLEVLPFNSVFTVQPGTYRGVDQPVKMPCYKALMTVRADVPDWVVTKILDLFYSDEGKKYLGTVHEDLKHLHGALEDFQRAGIPVHPAAEKFYKDKGIK